MGQPAKDAEELETSFLSPGPKKALSLFWLKDPSWKELLARDRDSLSGLVAAGRTQVK